MLDVAPRPIDKRATTAATPMTIPNTVNEERSILARKALRATPQVVDHIHSTTIFDIMIAVMVASA
jgi:hypothetical protein